MEFAALAERVRLLEQQNNRLRRLGLVLLLLLWGAGIAALAYSVNRRDRLVVRELVLVDEQGQPRALWGVKSQPQGRGAYLLFYDDQHRERGALGVDAEGWPLLALLGSDEKPRLALRLDHRGLPVCVFSDTQYRPRARCQADSDGSIGWHFLNGDGQTVSQLPAASSGATLRASP